MVCIVTGDGAMGRAVAGALAGRGTPAAAVLGEPQAARPEPARSTA